MYMGCATGTIEKNSEPKVVVVTALLLPVVKHNLRLPLPLHSLSPSGMFFLLLTSTCCLSSSEARPAEARVPSNKMQAPMDVTWPARKQFRVDDLFSDASEAVDELPTIDRNVLRDKARWIRDDLDLEVAREGPTFLTADRVVVIFRFLSLLRQSRVPIEDIR